MAFNNDILTKMASKALLGGVLDGSQGSYFESRSDFVFNLNGDAVWTEMSKLKQLKAKNIIEACNHTVNNPSLINKYGYDDTGALDGTAIRLNEVLGSNGTTFVAYTNYGDYSSKRLQNFIAPVLIPQDNSAPSIGYTARFFLGGPPNAGGVELSTVEGFDGEVAWYFNYASGVLLFDEALAPPSATIPSKDIWMVAFQYDGKTANDGSGFSGDTIELEADDGSLWRINASDGTHLYFERYDTLGDGSKAWNPYQYIGASTTTDGLTIARPYNIDVDFNPDAMRNNGQPDLRSVFRVSGTNNDFTYGNSEQLTILETAKGTDVVRAAALREEVEIENRPLNDLELVLDNTSVPEVGSFVEYSWVSNINYTTQTDYIRFNDLLFDVVEVFDDNGNPVAQAPIRISVETLNGELIQENISIPSLNAGINGGFNFKVGQHFYPINPKYSDIRFAKTVTRLVIAKGYKVKVKAGLYNYVDSLDNDTVKQQIVPYQKARVEFLDHAAFLDESNYKRLIHENSQVIIDTGIHTYYEGWSNNTHQLVGVGEHVLANRAVLGNYEAETYVATGSGGLYVLFQDDSTRTTFWTEGDRQRLVENKTPDYFITTKKLEIDLEGIFATEMNDLVWEVVNVEKFLPLMRYEGLDAQSYRVSIYSKVLEQYRFQENMTTFQYEDKVISAKHVILPSIDAVDPSYVALNLPRKSFSVNKATPRKIVYEFQEPVKIYGYYKDPTDVNDPINTGTFVPSVKAEVLRLFEEPVVIGSDLEDRVDQIQGEQEWAYATENNLPTLHIVPSLLWLSDEDGEALLFSDTDSLYTDQDEHQWIFSTGTEAYYEPANTQGVFQDSNRRFAFNPLVVHVPYDTVSGFSVSFGWHSSFNSVSTSFQYGVFKFYIATHGRGMDALVTINVPKNASINYQFTRRRDGRYAYRATPYNENLSSTVTSGGNLSYPEDPSPPIQVGTV